MTKFILHGGFTKVKNELNDGFYKEVVDSIPEGGTILLIYFSREDDVVEDEFKKESKRFLEQAGDKKLNLVLASKDNFIEQVKDANAIYMRGGSTLKLIDELKKHPEFIDVIRGKVVSGSSVGAQVLSTYYHMSSGGGIYEGLGILPIRLVCHYESDKFDYPDDPLLELDKYPKELELVVLKDYEWKVFDK